MSTTVLLAKELWCCSPNSAKELWCCSPKIGTNTSGICQILKFAVLRNQKIREILRKNIFCKKNIFFLQRKTLPILRFPYSFGVWGCWERSNTGYFVIFRVPGTPKSWISTRSCPRNGFSSLGKPKTWNIKTKCKPCATADTPDVVRINLKPP